MLRISLGLQGGGAHGAFTWGALDRLLEEPDVEIAGISGTSAGALNGAALKSGMLRGGRDGARAALADLWGQLGGVADTRMPIWMAPWLNPPVEAVTRGLELSVPFMAADSLSRVLSPYAWGPFYVNPLRRIVDRFDYDTVCADRGPVLNIGATHVRDGKIRVFSGDQITTDSILASACLPTVFQAVTCPDPLDGTPAPFWDGGYTGNPALFPLFEDDLPGDIVVISINPLNRTDVPRSAMEIQNRINEISFNSSLLRELRAINFVQRLLEDGRVSPGTMKALRVHIISDDALMNDLSVATKLVPLPGVISRLRNAGRAAADGFLAAHKADLGKRQTTDLRAMFG